MWKHTAFAIVVSVLLSVSSTLIVGRYQRRALSDTVRVKKLELVDEHSVVRGVMEVRRSGGVEWPQLTLFSDPGRDAILLRVGPHGEGSLVFNNYDSPGFPPEGVIRLGRLYMDDTATHSPSMSGWGLAVGSYGGGTVMGISDTNRKLGLSSLQTGAIEPAK